MAADNTAGPDTIVSNENIILSDSTSTPAAARAGIDWAAAPATAVYVWGSNTGYTTAAAARPTPRRSAIFTIPQERLDFPVMEAEEGSITISANGGRSVGAEEEWKMKNAGWLQEHPDVLILVHKNSKSILFYSDDIDLFETKMTEIAGQLGEENILCYANIKPAEAPMGFDPAPEEFRGCDCMECQLDRGEISEQEYEAWRAEEMVQNDDDDIFDDEDEEEESEEVLSNESDSLDDEDEDEDMDDEDSDDDDEPF